MTSTKTLEEPLQRAPSPARSSDASIRHTALRRRIVVLGTVVIIVLVVASTYGLRISYRQSVEATDRELTNLARALAEQTAWTWQAIDLLLQDTGRWYVNDGRARPTETVDQALAERAASVRQVREITIADADGMQRYRSDGRVSRVLDVSNRAHFVTARQGASTALFITEPLVTGGGARSAVLLSRRIEDDRRNFLGVVTATVDLQDLKDLYGAVQLGRGNAIALLRSDGTLLVRNPPTPLLVGRKLFPSIGRLDGAPVKLTSPIDGRRNFVAIAPVRDAPLVLAVMREEDVALSSWRAEVTRAVLRTLGFTLMGVLALVALIRQLNRIESSERALLESKERQAQSQKLEALGSLAGGIAHDFNNILGAILGYGEMAREDPTAGGTVRRYIDNVMLAAERAKILVDRILGFSRSGLSERMLVNVQAVIEETLELLAATLPTEIRLDKTLDAGNAAVFGDPTHLHQVAMNLCTNAAHAMPDGGTLRVTLTATGVSRPFSVMRGSVSPGRYVLLTVSDTGLGIPSAVLDRVFDPFFTTKGVGEGTGLGLSLVDGIVHDLGGAISVVTRPGEGTAFAVWLPVTGESARGTEPPAAEPSHGNGEIILIVDDERMLVALAEETLAGLGYEPVGFDSSMAALEVFRADPRRFDLVLTDENMPGLTGTELARELRRVRSDIPVVLMSGYGGTQLAERAAAIGISEVLRKPVQRRDLSEALARALRARPAKRDA